MLEDAKRKKSKRKRKNVSVPIRELVYKRDKRRCCRCGNKKNLHIHHKIHVEDGGTNDPSNLELLCDLCHALEHEGEPIYNLMIKSSFWEYEDAINL
ncbi:HNH endonuclease signature motif containing protein [Paenibacillus stellifer]|uniref:HNH endonuclease n=1 Tax=Paenibacillus stellifer TaxID=169760 RepID=UPI0009FDA741